MFLVYSQEVASFEALFTMGVFVEKGRGTAAWWGGVQRHGVAGPVSVRDTVYFHQVVSLLDQNTQNGLMASKAQFRSHESTLFGKARIWPWFYSILKCIAFYFILSIRLFLR